LWEKALAIARELGDRNLATSETIGIAVCALQSGDLDEALDVSLGALDEAVDIENIQLASWFLDFIAAFTAPAAPAAAARLAGAVESLHQVAGGGMALEPLGLEDARSVAARMLDPEDLARAYSEGRAMTFDETVAWAHELRRLVVGDPSDVPSHPLSTG
jgi:hypothetical protein